MKKIMKALLSLLMIVPISGCSGEKTVGRDIKIDDITEFYYTYSSSTNPPDYQRYRFYVEDGTCPSIIVIRRPFVVSVAIIALGIPSVNRNGTTGSKTAQLEIGRAHV